MVAPRASATPISVAMLTIFAPVASLLSIILDRLQSYRLDDHLIRIQ